MKDPRPNEVLRFWDAMTEWYRSTVSDKEDSWRMQAAAWFLDAVGVTDRDKFMNRFTTTINNRIYIPFELGKVHERYDLWSQITVCAHEHVHVYQAKRDGWSTFATRYLAHRSDRAAYEAEAFGCDLELYYWRNGDRSIDEYIKRRANVLRNYGVEKSDVTFVKEYLTMQAVTICDGGRINPVATFAIDWLDKNTPHLKG